MSNWKIKYEDSKAIVRVQVFQSDGGWKATHSVLLKGKGHEVFGNPRSINLQSHAEKSQAIQEAERKAADSILGDRLFSSLKGLTDWAESVDTEKNHIQCTMIGTTDKPEQQLNLF
jgi:hypothetical protein